MIVNFCNGRIVTDGYLYEDVPYDVSANELSVCFDGKGGVSKYLSARSGRDYSIRSMTSFYKNGERVGAYTRKQTKMVGRGQEITILGEGYRIEMKQFITKDDDAVFIEMGFFAEQKLDFTVVYGTGYSWEIPKFACDSECTFVEENMHLLMPVTVEGEKRIRLVFTYEESTEYCTQLLTAFTQKMQSVQKEVDDVVIPASAETEEEKALYLSALFCCIENYKELGDMKGFMAGCNYLSPMRTYYRDSYWTVLSAYNYDVSYVKRQVETLARGIAKDGTCPSAVKCDLSAFWGGHYDSPSFFVMMVYDYINHSGDKQFLQERIDDKTLLECCLLVIDKQMERTDGTGLLYKAGPFNKLDWADEVNRNGYVTYDEALYYRALYCMQKLCEAGGVDGQKYGEAAKKVKAAINDILWDEEKGYYVNYLDGDFVEDNLSVDTVITYLFGIAEGQRAERMLGAMERLLETKNNSMQKAGDYGVMCVYPFYKHHSAAYFKSSQDYEYHNGGNWPYWAAIYAYAKSLAGMEYKYALESWFSYNLDKGIFTPVEYFSPCRKSGSTLQAWSGAAAFVFDFVGKDSFFAPKYLK